MLLLGAYEEMFRDPKWNKNRLEEVKVGIEWLQRITMLLEKVAGHVILTRLKVESE